jgi:hypothetical protein
MFRRILPSKCTYTHHCPSPKFSSTSSLGVLSQDKFINYEPYYEAI